MEKQWHCIEFDSGITTVDTANEITAFLNKHKLKPEEIKLMPNHVYHTGYAHSDDKIGVTVLYFSDKELSRY